MWSQRGSAAGPDNTAWDGCSTGSQRHYRQGVAVGNIHPLASVSPDAVIAEDCQIGPFCVVESGVEIGPGCILESHVVVKTGTRLGAHNHIHEGAVLGARPQHLRHPGPWGGVVIGSHNVIREHVTIHRALEPGTQTTVGDHNFLMVNVHVAHDCQVGSHVIMANNVMLGGHVLVEDAAYLGGAAAVHQHCRIGAVAMVGGQAHVNKDVPPFVIVDGLSSLVVGLNLIGLRRRGFSSEQIRRLKEAYRLIFCSQLLWDQMLDQLQRLFPEEPAAHFHHFLRQTHRGILNQRRVPRTATIKLPQPAETPATQTQRKVG